jgi:hypothetical protein
MGIPQVPEQVRRAPLLALRAVFGGIGRLLMVADRPAAGAEAALSPARLCPVDQGPMEPAAPEAPPVSVAEVADETGHAADLPLPNYDALSLASIRARLRGLDVAQLKVLLDYEAAAAERAEVLRMFERRIEKLEAGA